MDPWDWSVDDVVANLCHNRELWSNRPHAVLPPSLERSIRQNYLDGASLLECADQQVLKEDLDINSLGPRLALIHGIKKLQQRSPKYLSEHPSTISRPSYINPSLPGSNFSPAQTPPHFDVNRKQHGLITPSAPNECHLRPEEAPLEHANGGKKRKRLQPTPIDTPSKSQSLLTRRAKPSRPTLSYLGTAKFYLDKMFYDDIKPGAVIQDEDDDEGSDDITIVGNKMPPQGQQIIFNRRLQFLFRNEPQTLTDSRVAFFPYPRDAVAPPNLRSLTVFQRGSDQMLEARRWCEPFLSHRNLPEDLEILDIGDSRQSNYLLEKYNPEHGEDLAVPAHDDSNSEEDYPASLLAEIEEDGWEREQTVNYKHSIPRDEVLSAVNDAIASYEQKWREDKLPRRDLRAAYVWRKARGQNRQALLGEAHQEMQRLHTRLEKLTDEICSQPWKNARQVQKQCPILSASVTAKMDWQWKLGVWKHDCPPTPQHSSFAPKVKKPRSSGNESDDEESLSSESDDLEEFMDIDHIAGLSNARNLDDHTSALEEGSDGESINQPMRQFSQHSEDESFSSSEYVDSILGASGARFGPNSAVVPVEGSGTGIENLDTTPRSIESVHSQEAIDEAAPKTPSVVDLTCLSSGPASPSHELDFSTPVTQTESESSLEKKNAIERAKRHPEHASWSEVGKWSFEYLEQQDDRKRLVMRLLFGISNTLYGKILHRTLSVSRASFENDMKQALNMIDKQQRKIQGVEPQDLEKIVDITRLFMCWTTCLRQCFWKRLDKLSTESHETLNSFATNFDPYYKFLRSVFELHQPRIPVMQQISPSKRDEVARQKRRKAQERKDRSTLKAREFNDSLQQSKDVDEAGDIPVNITKSDTEDYIYLNKYLSSHVKHHQIDGIRFMWRELLNDPSEQGCLLAHTMGLGKTMQTISILITLAEAAASSNEKISGQIPEDMKVTRALVLCPAGLIDNWKEEFKMWLNHSNILGTVVEMTSEMGKPLRIASIDAWHREGGVLILGYEMFRNLLATSSTRKTSTAVTPEEQETLRQQLLEGPSIVVADEAHKMKNQNSGIGLLAPKFRTERRIALTGSPLANHLADYYAMIDWVAPGYLGDGQEFRDRYQNPIQNGLYIDSSAYDKRRALKKLEVLKKEIDPKVSRADITALKGTLQPKTEFVIRFTLTDLQMEAYRKFIRILQDETSEEISQTKMFDWLNFLGHLCVHPCTFLEKLDDRERGKDRSQTVTDMAIEAANFDEVEPNEGSPEATELPVSLYKLEHDVFAGLSDLAEASLSNKTVIVREILLESRRVGDRVLIFSQHLKVLKYLYSFIKIRLNLRLTLLEGQTRLADRVNMSKAFNEGAYDVFLISTRAGGLGINIPGANRVILADFGFNPTWEEQAIGRAYRLGQPKPVYVYQLVTAGTYEDVLHNRAIFKKQLSMRAVDKKNPMSQATKATDLCFEPRKVTREDISQFRGRDRVLDRVLGSAAGAATVSIATTETLYVEQDEALTAEEKREVEQEFQESRRRPLGAADKARSGVGAQSAKASVAHPERLTADQQRQKRMLDASAARHRQEVPTLLSQPLAPSRPVLAANPRTDPNMQPMLPNMSPAQGEVVQTVDKRGTERLRMTEASPEPIDMRRMSSAGAAGRLGWSGSRRGGAEDSSRFKRSPSKGFG